jgi:signal transduction histidine kinase
LDLAKVDAGKNDLNKDLQIRIISSMIQVFDLKIKNLELIKEVYHYPRSSMGDKARLHQIILNLLGNALKYYTKGKITVSVSLLSEDEEK